MFSILYIVKPFCLANNWRPKRDHIEIGTVRRDSVPWEFETDMATG
jgi:hypothetical protein